MFDRVLAPVLYITALGAMWLPLAIWGNCWESWAWAAGVLGVVKLAEFWTFGNVRW